jgi:putative ABC transport system substrate-binding protein
VELQVVEARTPQEIANAFGVISTARVNALAVLVDPVFIAQRQRIAELATKGRLPTIYHLRQFVEAGGLISYGVDYTEAFQQSAVLADRILKGSKPADLPVEQPWRFPLVINLKTAKALGFTIPPSLLLRADQVIE